MRFGGRPASPDEVREGGPELGDEPMLPLPPVPVEIEPGRGYLVAELIFRYDLPGQGGLVWRALVELATEAVLFLECMTCAVHGLVFKRDPQVSTGDLTITSAASNAVLVNHDSDELLNALVPPAPGADQELLGTYVAILEEENPVVVVPTKSAGADFDFPSRTNRLATTGFAVAVAALMPHAPRAGCRSRCR